MTSHTHKPENSTSISEIHYDSETKDMHITFCSGGKHCFKDVERSDFDGFKTADSVGSHFHLHVRRKYSSEKVE